VKKWLHNDGVGIVAQVVDRIIANLLLFLILTFLCNFGFSFSSIYFLDLQQLNKNKTTISFITAITYNKEKKMIIYVIDHVI
jgi:hypothetical protein